MMCSFYDKCSLTKTPKNPVEDIAHFQGHSLLRLKKGYLDFF